MDEADRFLALAAKAEGLDYPEYQKKYGYGRWPHSETPVSSFGDSQEPASPASPLLPPSQDTIDGSKAASELGLYRDLGVAERKTGTLVPRKGVSRARKARVLVEG